MVQVNGNSGAPSGLGPQVAGVWGDSLNDRGVVGTSHGADGVRGISDRRSGVSGIGDIRPGVSGTSAADRGVYGSGRAVGVHGRCVTRGSDLDPTVYPGVFGEGADFGVYAVGDIGLLSEAHAGGMAGWFVGGVVIKGSTFISGDFIVTTGFVKSAAVLHPDGTHRQLCALESPESWFEDFGRAELRAGRAEVALDADFAALVETDDYHVFLTPEGESGGLYVSARTSGTFEVREQADGKSTLGFSYRIVARRKDVTHERLAVVEIPPALERRAPELDQVDPELAD